MDNNRQSEERKINPHGDETQTADTLLEDDLPKVGQTGPDYKKYVVFGLVILLLLFINLRSCFKKEDAPVVSDTKAVKYAPDYHDVSRQAMAEKSEQSPTVKPKENSEFMKLKLAYLEQQRKMYRMRQSASIDLLKESGGGNRSVSSVSSLSSLSANVVKTATGLFGGNAISASKAGTGKLPLSTSQIEALRQSQPNYSGNRTGNTDTVFQERSKTEFVETTEAIQIPHQDDTVAQGSLISGVLQTAINTDLPGMLKANVSEDVYSINGRKKLIPKGSILIGQYNSGILLGQKRVLVMWTRLIRPDGVYVMLGSPGTDSLGRSGLGADVLETHFWERFGEASLLSIIGTGIATAGVEQDAEYNSESAYRMMLASNFQSTANATLSATMSQKPTIHVYQGSKINVFVNRDLSFYDLTQRQGE